MKGKAVVFTEERHVSVQEVDIPEPSSEDVVIDVQYSWISNGTESSFLRGERISGEQLRTENDPYPFPYVAGYQKVGVVRSVGEEVQGIEVGDRVFATCSKVANMFFPIAGHISPAVTPQHQVWKLPEGMPSIHYAGMVLTQVGFNCGIRPPVHKGDVAVVIGDGLVGHWAAQTLSHRGAEVVVLGRHDKRLNHLPDSIKGINISNINIKHNSPINKNISIIVDTVGAMQTVKELQPRMRRESHWVSAGFLGDTGIIDIQTLREQEITLHTPSGWSQERMDQTLIGISEGWLQTKNLITHHFPVDEADQAWDLILSKSEPFLGIILDW